MRRVETFRELDVYKSAFELQQWVFSTSKAWPKEEVHSLTSQIRRSSRSIGANIAEAWAKRRYPAHFLSKLTDADAELQETLHWLVTAHQCEYLSEKQLTAAKQLHLTVGPKLGAMIKAHESFCEPKQA
jgi:four helix bundle protein